MVGIHTVVLQSGSVPSLAYFAIPLALLVVLWKSLVIPGENATVALVRDGDVVRTTDELSLTVPFLTERRTVPTDRRGVQVGPMEVETSDGVRAEIEGSVYLTVDDPTTFATETDSASSFADRVAEACTPALERAATRASFHEVRERVADELERAANDATHGSGAEVAEVRPYATKRDLPAFYPYHERFERRDGQLYAVVDGASLPVADLFYDESTDLADCKLLDVDLEEQVETVEDEGIEVEVTEVSVPADPDRSWSGAPRFDGDGTPYTTTESGDRVSVYRLFDLEAVDAATTETVASALPDDVDAPSMLIWGSDGHLVTEEASLTDVLAAE